LFTYFCFSVFHCNSKFLGTLLREISPMSQNTHWKTREKISQNRLYYFSPPYRQKHRLTLSECGEAGGQLRRPPAAAAADGGGCSPAAVAVAGAACTATPAPQHTFLKQYILFSDVDPDPDVFGLPDPDPDPLVAQRYDPDRAPD
jgi:hypothetical protein